MKRAMKSLHLSAGRFAAGLLLMAAAIGAVQADEKQYLIQPGDILTVSVWKEKDMTADVLVRPDGKFSFPLAGDIQASGRSVNDVQTDLIKKISTYIPDAVATVLVKDIPGNRAYVIGKVNRPGPVPMATDTDVMQALSVAGGTATFAALKDIIILRRESGKLTAIPFNYDQVQSGKHLEQNVILQPGDVVVVP